MNRILKLISSSDWDAEANKVFENDLATSRTDSDLEDWDAQSFGHVTDLDTVNIILGNWRDD